MRLSQIINVRRAAAIGALSASLWCAQVGAQVLEQVPSDALAVFKINDLEKTSGKVAKLAKTFGLDELSPEMKDPLGSVLEKGKMTKGINKAGDAALVIYAPDEHKKADAEEAMSEEPVALIPVSDYDAFVSNFKPADKPDAGEGISAVKDNEGDKTLYVAHRGNYAILSDSKAHLKSKGGIKLSKLAARESDTKDAVFFFNMPVVREKALPQIKEHRKELIDEMDKGLAAEAQLKPFVPVFDTIVNHAIDTANDFLEQADGVVFSMNIGDTALTGGALVEFAPDSKFGKTVAELKAGSTPLLTGLPEGKYFVFAGGSFDRKAIGNIAGEWLDPVSKSLNETNTDAGKKIAKAIDEFKTVMASTDHSAVGMIAPTKPMGQESLIQEVVITHGDAKAIASAEKSLLTEMNDLMALAPQNKGVKTTVAFGDPKMIDGVELQTYSTKMDFDKNDPQGMQAEQILAMIYGPAGASGAFGVVNDKTFILAQGASDEVLKEVIAAAKAGKDVLSDSENVKAVSAQLPPHPSAVYYVALDNIVTTALRYAQGFGLQVKMKIPANLPPIGVAVSTEDSAIRVDGVVPTQTVQALIAAGLQAYTDMQQGGKGGGL